MSETGSRPQEAAVDSRAVEGFRRGDPQAVARVVGAFGKRLVGFIRVFTRNQEVAKEVAQEVFVEACRKREQFRAPEELSAWLFTVAKRKAIRATERKSYTHEIGMDREALDHLSPSVAPEQGARLQLDQLGGHLSQALDKLPPEEREILALRYFGQLRIGEIAETARIPMGSVGGKIDRALAKVRRVLEEKGIRPEDVKW
ncbi:MAG: ECF RNA polymerase sigma factor SigW [bacterium]|nr:ECF RNA polymerase sigma factor SigW [bacterium]